MKYITILIKPASSLCNLKCKYCFYEDLSKQQTKSCISIMNCGTMHTIIEKALAIDEKVSINFSFQGGEPTLAGLQYYKDFVDYVNREKKSQSIRYSIQTNGISLNEDWFIFFKEHKFLVGISLDGTEELHDKNRIQLSGSGSFKLVVNSILQLKRKQIEHNILCVITKHSSQYAKVIYDFFSLLEIEYVQFIPCLPAIGNPFDEFALTPRYFFDFYQLLFNEWFIDYKKGKPLNISLFMDIISLVQGLKPIQCGAEGRCYPQYIIESNGEVYPCDFYALDEYRVANINECDFYDIAKSKIMYNFLMEPRRESKLCNDCRFLNVCNQNCKRMNIVYYNECFCGYKELLEYIYMKTDAFTKLYSD